MAIFNSKEIEALRKENQELKNQLHGYSEQEEKAGELGDLMRRLQGEIADLNSERGDLSDEILILKNDKKIKESELNELSNKIPELNGLKKELQHKLIDYSNRVDILKKEIESLSGYSSEGRADDDEGDPESFNLLKKENGTQRKEIKRLNDELERLLSQQDELEEEIKSDNKGKLKAEEKILEDLRKRELKILRGIESKKEEVKELIKKVEVLHERDKSERENLKNLYKEIEERKREKEYYSGEEVRLLNNVARLKEKEDKLSNEITNQEQEIKAKDEILNMLTKNIAHKQEKEVELDKDLKELDAELRERSNSIHTVSNDFSRISEEKNNKQRELFEVTRELETKNNKLTGLKEEFTSLESKLAVLEKDVETSDALKKELSKKVSDQAEVYEKLKEQSDLLRQTIPLLEKKKAEIENENAALEERFGKVFQKYSKDVNELSRKRIFYEKVVMDKEREINEKDQTLFEKIAALEESERVLGLRQAEINSFKDSLKDLTEEKETVGQDIESLETKTTEILRRNEGLRMETEYLMSKKQSIEDSMKEILNDMNERFEKTRTKKHDVDEEIAGYEDRLHITRERISESRKELSELQASIGRLKLEHEEQRGYITKLAAKKNKLLEEISRSQTLLQKYDEIKEKAKVEKASTNGKEGGILESRQYQSEVEKDRGRKNPSGL